MSIRLLTKKERAAALRTLGADWKLLYKDTKLTKAIPTKNFLDGLKLLSKITVHAEILNHHPEVTISYHQVKVTLITHEAKGITAKDITLAKKIDRL